MAADEQFDVFVSYSTKDALIAAALAGRLKSDGVRYWWAPESLAPGTSYQEIIARDIPRCRVMLVLLSDKANYSNHVERELLFALEEGKPILPVRIEPVEPSVKLRYALTGAQRLDAFPSFRQHLDAISGTLRTRLETLKREAPVLKVLEPVDKFTAVRGAPLHVSFEVLLGTERRLKRARLEIRRDGALLAHRPLAESELNDRGGVHHVDWLLPPSLADGGHFQLAVLAGDTEGQEGSAEMQGSFALTTEAPSPAPIAAPPPAPAPVSPAPPVAGKPSRGARATAGAFATAWTFGVWSFRLVWMLALAGALANVAYTLAEPYTATQESHVYPRPKPVTLPELIPQRGRVFDLTGPPGSKAEQMTKTKAPTEPAAPTPKPAPGDLTSEMLRGAGLSNSGPGLGRFNPSPLEDLYVVKGPRQPGRPVTALISALTHPTEIGKHFHAAIPLENGMAVSLMDAAWQGAGLGARLGIIAGIIAGLLALLSAMVQRLPLEMMPLGEEQHFMADFGILAIVAAVTILDTGADQPDTGRWTTPLFWWVAILTVFCFLGSTALKSALNRKRQAKLLG